MTTKQFNRLIDQLVLHEGLRLKSYKCTAGKWTIGVGRNFEDNPFTPAELMMLGVDAQIVEAALSGTPLYITRQQAFGLLKNDIENCIDGLTRALPWFVLLDPIRQRVFIDMAFNMGIVGLLKFKNTLEAARVGDWLKVRRGMLSSRWAKQVGDGEGGRWDRAERLAQMAFTGNDYIK